MGECLGMGASPTSSFNLLIQPSGGEGEGGRESDPILLLLRNVSAWLSSLEGRAAPATLEKATPTVALV